MQLVLMQLKWLGTIWKLFIRDLFIKLVDLIKTKKISYAAFR